MIDLTGQTALIIGADDTLARGIAGRLLAAGAGVIAHARFNDAPDDARIEQVVIIPPFTHSGDVVRTDPAGWDDALLQNFEAVVFDMQNAAQHMIDNGIRGSIIVIGGASMLTPIPGMALSSVSLAALRPVVKMAAVECAPHGVRVNMIAPGVLSADDLPIYADPSQIVNDIPLGRTAEPEDVGDVCCFLASPLARYITGALIPVDGGFSLTRADAPLEHSPHMNHE